MTEERPARGGARPTEVVVRVDGGRKRRPSLTGVLALAVVGALLFVAVGFANGWLGLGNLFTTRNVDRSAPVIVHRLRNLSSYRAASGTFSVVVDQEKDVSILPQFMAGSRVIYNGYGSVDATVNLSRLDPQHVTHASDGGIVITLPHARAEHAVLDPRSHVMSRKRGLADRLGGIFTDSPTSERPLEHAARIKMERAARHTNLLTKAERNTATMVKSIAKTVGVDQVTVRFA